MIGSRAGWVAVAAIACTIAAALAWQRFAMAELAAELIGLREAGRELAQLQTENARLRQGQIPAADLERMDRAVLAALQRELEITRQKQEHTTVMRDRPVSYDAEISGTGADLLRSGTMRDARGATPQAAGETLIRALGHGDIDTAAEMIAFHPAARTRMEAVVATLPPAFKAEYGTPERLMAFVMAGSPPVATREILSETQTSSGALVQRIKVVLRDGSVRLDQISFQRGGSGWQRLILPGAAEQAAEFLNGGSATN
jgi:hypothetical protein